MIKQQSINDVFTKDVLALILSYVSRAPKLRVVCRHWKDVLSSQTFERFWEEKHTFEMQYIRVLVLERLFEMVEGAPYGRYGVKYKTFNDDNNPVEVYSIHESEAQIEKHKEEYNCELFLKTKERWKDCVFEFETYKHPRFVIPYTGWSPDRETYARVSTFFYYEKGKLIKSYGGYRNGLTYYNYQGFDWIRDIHHKKPYYKVPYKVTYSNRSLGWSMYSPHKSLYKRSPNRNGFPIINERIEIMVNDNGKCDFDTFKYIYKDGKKVYQIKKGKVYRVKRKKIGIQPGRSRMQVIKEKFIPVADTEKVNFRTLPGWMKEDIDQHNNLFDEIKKYIN